MGGPVEYSGRELGEAHARLHIGDEEFSAIIEHLVAALREFDVPPDIIDRVVTALSATRPDIVTADCLVDVQALKHTWGLAEKAGDDVPLFFYSHLFLAHPGFRSMFPVSMTAQRDKLVSARAASSATSTSSDEVTGFIQQLGRDHRRFQVVAENYGAVGASLLVTLKHFLGSAWTPGSPPTGRTHTGSSPGSWSRRPRSPRTVARPPGAPR